MTSRTTTTTRTTDDDLVGSVYLIDPFELTILWIERVHPSPEMSEP